MLASQNGAQDNACAPEGRIAGVSGIDPGAGILPAHQKWTQTPQRLEAQLVGVVTRELSAVNIIGSDVRFRAPSESHAPLICADITHSDAEVHVVGALVREVWNPGQSTGKVVAAVREFLILDPPVVEPPDGPTHRIAGKRVHQSQSNATTHEERIEGPLLLLEIR